MQPRKSKWYALHFRVGLGDYRANAVSSRLRSKLRSISPSLSTKTQQPVKGNRSLKQSYNPYDNSSPASKHPVEAYKIKLLA